MKKANKHIKEEQTMDAGTATPEAQVIMGSGSSLPGQAFSRKRMFIYVAIFAILGVVALIATLALTPSNGDFEAETMTVEAL